MRKQELLDLIRGGKDSMVEFKRDDVRNFDLAKEIVALLNLEGGTILLGVEDDGSISGTSRARLEEWIAEICRVKIQPPMIPNLTWGREIEPGKDVLGVKVPIGPDKPYARIHDNKRTYFIRVGSTSREAGREELERMFQASGGIQYGLKPVPGTSLQDFDIRRLRDYFGRVLSGHVPDEKESLEWERLLSNLDLMTDVDGEAFPTIDGLLLFGKNPKRYLPQAGIRALCYPGSEADYATRADQDLKHPLVGLFNENGELEESGLADQAIDFVRRNTQPRSRIEGGRRIDHPAYPEFVLREVIVNALVHRDYSIAGSDITLTVYDHRLEVTSPGRLPNTVTLEGMKAGMRYARNQTLVNVMRDYGYVDFHEMGVRNKVIPGMRDHNGTEPGFIVEEHRFTVRLEEKRKSQDGPEPRTRVLSYSVSNNC